MDNGDWTQLSDTVLTYNPTAKLSLMGNVDYGRVDDWTVTRKSADYAGIAAYAKYAVNSKVAIAGRYEYLNDHDGYATRSFSSATPPVLSVTPQHLNEFTGTLERRIAGHLLSRLEYRYDASNEDFFQRGGPSFVKGQTTVDAGLVFVLEPDAAK
jgi:hypothetical protein